jgi:ribonuclease D
VAACAEALKSAGNGPDEGDVLRQLPAAATLQPAQVGVLQELATWRLERARATNQPVRSVLADAVLVDLARRQPPTVSALLANRRFPKSIARDAEALVERIVRAKARPPAAAPKVIRKRSPEWRSVTWLQLLVDVIGERRRFSGNLLLSRPLAESMVLEPPTDRQSLAARLGWRDPLIGDDLSSVQRGQIALTWEAGDVSCRPSLPVQS